MDIKGTRFMIGADPEVFLKRKDNGRYVSAVGVISGTKREPYRIGGGCAWQVDGMACEFNTRPASTCEGFIESVQHCKGELVYRASTKGLVIAIEPTVTFDEEEWSIAPEEAKILGCESDLNAWTGLANHPPNAAVDFRTGAGHIHVSWGEEFTINTEYVAVCQEVVRELDANLGVASLLFDGDNKRRELYGKAGAFRPKRYGLEYRVLSNSWVRNQQLMRYVYNRTYTAFDNLMYQRPIYRPEVKEIIDNGDTSGAHAWMCHQNIPLPPVQYRVA